jgi:hypothetical protein
MAARFTRLTHKIAIQLHLVAESCVPFAVLAAGGQSGNFWMLPRILLWLPINKGCDVVAGYVTVGLCRNIISVECLEPQYALWLMQCCLDKCIQSVRVSMYYEVSKSLDCKPA